MTSERGPRRPWVRQCGACCRAGVDVNALSQRAADVAMCRRGQAVSGRLSGEHRWRGDRGARQQGDGPGERKQAAQDPAAAGRPPHGGDPLALPPRPPLLTGKRPRRKPGVSLTRQASRGGAGIVAEGTIAAGPPGAGIGPVRRGTHHGSPWRNGQRTRRPRRPSEDRRRPGQPGRPVREDAPQHRLDGPRPASPTAPAGPARAASATRARSSMGRYRGLDLTLVKPLTFMNDSGLAVRKVLAREHAPLDDLLVVADDFALPFGKLRFREGGGPGGHNGLRLDHRRARDREVQPAAGRDRRARTRGAIDHVLAPFEAGRAAAARRAARRGRRRGRGMGPRTGRPRRPTGSTCFELRPADGRRRRAARRGRRAAGRRRHPADEDGLAEGLLRSQSDDETGDRRDAAYRGEARARAPSRRPVSGRRRGRPAAAEQERRLRRRRRSTRGRAPTRRGRPRAALPTRRSSGGSAALGPQGAVAAMPDLSPSRRCSRDRLVRDAPRAARRRPRRARPAATSG